MGDWDPPPRPAPPLQLRIKVRSLEEASGSSPLSLGGEARLYPVFDQHLRMLQRQQPCLPFRENKVKRSSYIQE